MGECTWNDDELKKYCRELRERSTERPSVDYKSKGMALLKDDY